MGYSSLISYIQSRVYENDSQAISGTGLQEALLQMVASLGDGYQFKGVATPATNPGTPDQNVFYIASEVGTYSNFGLSVGKNEVALFLWDGSWSKQSTGAASAEAVNQLGLKIDGNFELEQGGIDWQGTEVEMTNRVRTVGFINVPFVIKTNSGFIVRNEIVYNNSGVFVQSNLVSSDTYTYQGSNTQKVRLVFAKSNDGNLSPSDAIIESSNGGMSLELAGIKTEIGKLDDNIEKFVVPKFSLGSIDGMGNEVASTTRARSTYIFGGFHISLKAGYSVFCVLRYANGVASSLYEGGANGPSEFEVYDESFTYRVVVCKTGGDSNINTFDFIDEFIPGEEIRAARFNGNTWLNYAMEIHGEVFSNTKRLTYFLANGAFKISLKTGYAIFKVMKYNQDYSFADTEYYGGLTGQRQYETKDDAFLRSIQICKTDGTDIAPSDDFIETETLTPSERITELSGLVSGYSPKWEQGGIGEDGSLADSDYRVRTKIIQGPFSIALKSGYSIFRIAKYNDDGTFDTSIYSGYASGASSRNVPESGNYRIAVCKTGGAETILPTDDFVESFDSGLEYRVENLEKGADNEQKKKIVSANYEYNGGTLTLPSSPEDIYGLYDGLAAKYPQFVTRTKIGQSRDTFTINVPNLGLLPFCIETPVDVSNYSSLEIGGVSYEVKEVYAFEGYWYVRLLNATNGNVIPESGNIAYNGTTLGTYRRGLYGRYNGKLGTSNVYITKGSTNQLVGIVLDESTPNATGNLYDENDNLLSTYSGLQDIEGDDIYRYDFDFSANRTTKVDAIGIIGGVHSGSEPRAILGLSTFFRDLCENWDDSDELSFARMARYSIVPLVNPWGLRNTVNYNEHGVDLNRNFPDGFTQTNMLYFRWGGDSALSEPEVVAVNNFFLSIKGKVACVFDFHNDQSSGGNFQPTSGAFPDWINALSVCLNTNAGRNYPAIPSFLFAWKNGASVVYTNTPNPTTEDVAYTTQYGPTTSISSVGQGYIVVGGVTYNRDNANDVNNTNIFPIYDFLPNGSAIKQANALGLRNPALSECGGWYYIPTSEQLKFQVEMTANVLIASAKYWLS